MTIRSSSTALGNADSQASRVNERLVDKGIVGSLFALVVRVMRNAITTLCRIGLTCQLPDLTLSNFRTRFGSASASDWPSREGVIKGIHGTLIWNVMQKSPSIHYLTSFAITASRVG